jgi:ABC-type transporter Mla MlaB component
MGSALCHSVSLRVMMLKITVQEKNDAIGLTVEGRLAGPWTAELGRAWVEVVPRLADKKFTLDLRDLTYADAAGKQLLITIYEKTRAELVTNTPWTQYLAEEITRPHDAHTDAEV